MEARIQAGALPLAGLALTVLGLCVGSASALLSRGSSPLLLSCAAPNWPRRGTDEPSTARESPTLETSMVTAAFSGREAAPWCVPPLPPVTSSPSGPWEGLGRSSTMHTPVHPAAVQSTAEASSARSVRWCASRRADVAAAASSWDDGAPMSASSSLPRRSDTYDATL